MATEDAVGIQTRAMTEAQRTENEAQQNAENNQEEGQRAVQGTGEIAHDPAMNPVVEIHKNDDVIIEEYVQCQGGIGLDWYVPDFANTQVKTLIRERVKCTTQRGRILFTCPPLNEFFPTSTFELDLATGCIYTFLTPPEDIGIPCQQEEFDLELLARKLQNDPENSEMCVEELERIPRIKKKAAPAGCMELEEVENKYQQYMQLWILYVEISIELRKKSELSKESAVNACRVYGPYIADILRQVEEVIKLFSMEKELRKIRNRGEFPVPRFTPDGIKIKNTQDKDRVLTQVDREVEDILRAVRRNEEKYEREQEEAKNRDQQLRLTRQRQTDRSDFNFFNVINSTPIRNNNPRSDQPAVHFDTNPVQHHYTPTNPTTNGDRYKPPANYSITQGATSVPANQFATNATEGTGCNEQWRYNNGANTATRQDTQTHTTRQSGCNNFQYNSPNLSDNQRGVTCYRCGKLGHIKADCKERVYCTTCRSAHHDTKACRKHRNNTPSPPNNHIPTRYHPTATPPPLIGTTTGDQPTQQTNTTNGHYFQNLFENQIPRNNMVPNPQYNGASPAPSANMTEAFTQILAHVTDNKNNNVSR